MSFIDNLLMGITQGISNQNAYEALNKAKTPKELKEYDQSQFWFTDSNQQKMLEAERQKRINDFYAKEAQPQYNAFLDKYNSMTGTVDPRFLGDPAFKAELVKQGLQIPDFSNNPVGQKSLQDFLDRGRLANMERDQLIGMQQGEQGALADVMRGRKMDNLGNGITQMNNAATQAVKQAEVTNKKRLEDFNLDNTKNFRSSIAGLLNPLEREYNNLKATDNRMTMPEIEQLVNQAASDYPVSDTERRNTIDDYRQMAEKTAIGKPYETTQRVGDTTSKITLQNFLSGEPKKLYETTNTKSRIGTDSNAGSSGGELDNIVSMVWRDNAGNNFERNFDITNKEDRAMLQSRTPGLSTGTARITAIGKNASKKLGIKASKERSGLDVKNGGFDFNNLRTGNSANIERATSKSGRPIIRRNGGDWEYE